MRLLPLLLFRAVTSEESTVNCASVSFSERVVTQYARSRPTSVAATDVDGDGDVDALSASVGDDTVAWYENDGSESFTERVVTTLADYAFSVFAIDVDGDGDVDALGASVNDDTVAWYENGGGAFADIDGHCDGYTSFERICPSSDATCGGWSDFIVGQGGAGDSLVACKARCAEASCGHAHGPHGHRQAGGLRGARRGADAAPGGGGGAPPGGAGGDDGGRERRALLRERRAEPLPVGAAGVPRRADGAVPAGRRLNHSGEPRKVVGFRGARRARAAASAALAGAAPTDSNERAASQQLLDAGVDGRRVERLHRKSAVYGPQRQLAREQDHGAAPM